MQSKLLFICSNHQYTRIHLKFHCIHYGRLMENLCVRTSLSRKDINRDILCRFILFLLLIISMIKKCYMLYTHALSRNINYVAIDSQVCFHRCLFANPVKLHCCITEPVRPLGSTNQNWWDAKLLLMAVSIYPVDYTHLCYLLRTQHHCLYPNVGRTHLWLAHPPPPLPARLYQSTPFYMKPVIAQGL